MDTTERPEVQLWGRLLGRQMMAGTTDRDQGSTVATGVGDGVAQDEAHEVLEQVRSIA